ncbi:MAG: NAD-dependent epimerase/dehydratase family protein [Gammaproteobacteria bacterium]|nr:NAD-dependent epimerase/dehydratase family protein [Gammaproteobacteria bacterium]
MSSARILVTGATGFIGRAVTDRLVNAGFLVRGTRRGIGPTSHPNVEFAHLDLESHDPISRHLFRDVAAVVHLAAHVHASGLRGLFWRRFWRVNALGTLRLAEAAAQCRVRRFVFVSTIGVNGGEQPEDGPPSRRYTEADRPNPRTYYAKSKRAAEDGLVQLCMTRNREFVILRPPLVFGPGVPGSFLRLLQAVDHGLPLPLRGTEAWRSIQYVHNLADLILQSLVQPQAMNRIFLASDYDVHIPALVSQLAVLMGRPDRMWKCPRLLLRASACLPVLGPPLRRLTRSLLINSSSVQTALDWSPPIDLETALQSTVNWYLARQVAVA